MTADAIFTVRRNGDACWEIMNGNGSIFYVEIIAAIYISMRFYGCFRRTYIKANLNLIKNPLPYQYPHPNPNLPFYIGCKPNPNPNPHSNLESYIKEKLGPELEAVRVKAGGRVRVEPGGDAFIRTICKLTHIHWA